MSSLTLRRHCNSGLSIQFSFPRQDVCKTRKGTKYCITKQGSNTDDVVCVCVCVCVRAYVCVTFFLDLQLNNFFIDSCNCPNMNIF